MDQNFVILSLEYSYLINSLVGFFESNSGLWQNQESYSHTLMPYPESKGQKAPRIIDNLASLRSTLMMLNNNGMGESNHIKLIEPQLASQLITVSINGNETFINNSRTEILKAYHHVNFKRIPLRTLEVEKIGANFAHRLDAIAKRCNVEIIISSMDTDFKAPPKTSTTTSVFILGSTDNTCLAETETKILIDTLLRNCLVDRVSVPLSLIPIIGGPGLANFAEITRQLNVTIYLPYLMPLIFHSEVLETNDDMKIWMTSNKTSEVKLTMANVGDLIDVVDPRKSSDAKLYTQTVEFPKEKLDLVGVYHQNDISNIMLKHGVYIQIPSFGEPGNNKVIVQGNSKDTVSSAIEELSTLSGSFYGLNLKFRKGLASAELEYYFINLISNKKTCVLTYNENGIYIIGERSEVRCLLREFVSNSNATTFFTSMMSELDAKLLIEFSMELNNLQKEFLSGKKNGKIAKILNQLNHIPTIKYEHLNDLNFIIKTSVDAETSYKNKQLLSSFEILNQAVKLIEMEMPAEMHFNIPEVFHKSIIGNGGSTIQSIMKRYNVFIKFSSSAGTKNKTNDKVSEGKILYLFKRRDNVLIKCPMKNLKNILFVKHEIDQLVSQCCQNKCPPLNGISAIYHNVDVKLYRSHYSMLIKKMKYDLRFINELEAEHGTFISFPSSLQSFLNNSSFLVSIKGGEMNTKICAQRLAQLFPQSYEFQLTYCPGKFEELISHKNQEFRDKIVIPLKLLLDIEIDFSTLLQAQPCFHQLILSSYDEKNLGVAVQIMTHFLREKQFLIINKQQLKTESIYSDTALESSPTKKNSGNRNRSPSRSPNKNHKRPLKSITNEPVKNKKVPTPDLRLRMTECGVRP